MTDKPTDKEKMLSIKRAIAGLQFHWFEGYFTRQSIRIIGKEAKQSNDR